MPGQDNEDRYNDILNRIARRNPIGRARPEAKPQTPHDRVLNLVNAFDALARLTRDEYERYLCYGPKSFRGSAWSGVAIWYHRKGYHGYQTLYLLGVWAHYSESDIVLTVGIRQLPYRAPVYDAGVYRVAIRNNFRIYYDDAGGPPGESDRLLYQSRFKENERLSHRQWLRDILGAWRREIDSG